jgi:hypothetical protein
MATKKTLKPLAISCGSADCENKLHCFHKSRRLSTEQKENWKKGICVYCATDTVDWGRVRKRNLADVNGTIRFLRCEWIRTFFWENELTQRIIDNACRSGRVAMETRVDRRLRSSVGLPRGQNPWDGRQTPFKGKGETIITRGQHAMACCCRTCMEQWHGIPADAPLSEEHIEYFKKLLLMFIDKRMPSLKPEPQKIPRQKKAPDRSTSSTQNTFAFEKKEDS